MMFEEFVNNIKSINKIVDDEDIRDIETYIGFIEENLIKSVGKTKINRIP